MNSFFPTLIVNNYWLYVFIYMNKLWLIDWLIAIHCVNLMVFYILLWIGEKKIKNVTFWKNSLCHSFLNKITDQSSQWKMFLEIDVPKKKSKIIKKYKWISSFFGYKTVKNLQIYWLLLCPEFLQKCFDHERVINGHVHFLDNNREKKVG